MHGAMGGEGVLHVSPSDVIGSGCVAQVYRGTLDLGTLLQRLPVDGQECDEGISYVSMRFARKFVSTLMKRLLGAENAVPPSSSTVEVAVKVVHPHASEEVPCACVCMHVGRWRGRGVCARRLRAHDETRFALDDGACNRFASTCRSFVQWPTHARASRSRGSVGLR